MGEEIRCCSGFRAIYRAERGARAGKISNTLPPSDSHYFHSFFISSFEGAAVYCAWKESQLQRCTGRIASESRLSSRVVGSPSTCSVRSFRTRVLRTGGSRRIPSRELGRELCSKIAGITCPSVQTLRQSWFTPRLPRLSQEPIPIPAREHRRSLNTQHKPVPMTFLA